MQMHISPLNSDIAGALLFDRLRRSDVGIAVASHMEAVGIDECSFDANGNALSEKLAEETRVVEVERFSAFIRTPCQSPEDVQAKLRYILHGTVGDRDDLLTCLTIPEYGGDHGWEDFLRSLLLSAHANAQEEG
jgi:hypothetical protein